MEIKTKAEYTIVLSAAEADEIAAVLHGHGVVPGTAAFELWHRLTYPEEY